MTSASFLRRCVLLCFCAALPALVSASPIISEGSSYGYRLRPGSIPGSSITGITFDGVDETYALSSYGGPAGRNVTINESQTDLGSGAHTVLISLLGDGELFPVAGESGHVNIGLPGNDPLDLLHPARLLAAVVSMYAGDTLLASADFVPVSAIHSAASTPGTAISSARAPVAVSQG